MTRSEAEGIVCQWAKKRPADDFVVDPKATAPEFTKFGRWAIRKLLLFTAGSATEAVVEVLNCERYPKFGDVLTRCVREPQPEQEESFLKAMPKPQPLPFADGTYVTWKAPRPKACNDLCFQGGIVRKRPTGDYIDEVPHWIKGLERYIFLSEPFYAPGDVRLLERMNDAQRKSWVEQIGKWKREARDG